MKIFFILYLIIIFFCIPSVKSQTNNTIKAINIITREPVKGALINVIKDKSVYQTSTDSAGIINLPLLYLTKEFMIKVSAAEFVELSISGNSFGTQNMSTRLLQLTPTVKMLKDVVIKGERRYSDTITIKLASRHFDQSIMINDLFKNTEGLHKDSNGQLYYNNKLVTDVYVNGNEFFGKNNMDVYKDIPALTIEDINVVETNIESRTNATLANPTVKINFKLKEKYNKGKFGNLTVSGGSLSRYFFNTDLYTYNKNEQVSFAVRANDVSNNILSEPDIAFLPNGNDINKYSSTFSYHKTINSKLELGFTINGRKQKRNYQVESDRKDEASGQFSNIKNSSSTRSYNMDPSNISITYKINSLSKISIREDLSYRSEEQMDSLRYVLTNNNLNTIASAEKLRKSSGYTMASAVIYEQQIASKKGRYLKLNFNYNLETDNANEHNNVLNTENQNKNNYYIFGYRSLRGKKIIASVNYNEPVLNNGTLQFFINYNNEKLDYKPNIYSDKPLVFADSNTFISYINYQIGIKVLKKMKDFSFDESITGVLFSRYTPNLKNKFLKFYPNIHLNFIYNINKTNDLNLQFKVSPDYPKPGQTTSINNTFDLVSQNQGNINLNPEVSSELNFSYNIRKSNSLNISLIGSIEHFNSKYGYKIGGTTNNNLVSYIDNIGEANSGKLTFSSNKTLESGHTFGYNSNILYIEMPINNNDINYINKCITFNQSISVGTALIKDKLKIMPTISSSFSRLIYEFSASNIFTLIYSDKIAYNLGKIQIATYPLLNFSYSSSLNKSVSWAMNGDAKMNILKNNASLWVKAYDIFNSFKYYNNYAGANYTQTLKYSNLNRYILLGISLKINNMRN